MSILIFEEYSYSYAPDLQPALNGINLEIKRDECTVIVGPSGAGKTTFCLAAANLLSSYPASISSGHLKRPIPHIRTALVMQNFYSQITYLRNTVFEE
ncbi:MAG: ATP-binding cassette domain-containing protein, partial [Candidatus Kryptoniota bacterium]